MIQNLKVTNLTGREIDFDLAAVLESSPVFEKSTQKPNCWEIAYCATVSVGDSVSITPYAFSTSQNYSVGQLQAYAIERAINTLSTETSYLYRCHAAMEWDQRQLRVTLRETAEVGTVFFGRYFQKNNQKEPVQWLVLDRRNGEALLLSRFALHTCGYWQGNPWQAYQDNGKQLIWENSDFRKWLNGEFCQMVFSDEEQTLLLDTQIKTWEDSHEETLHNKIFLLSKEQAESLLLPAGERISAASEFAAFGGAYQWEGKCCWWILPYRDDCTGEIYLQAVLPDGKTQYHSRNVAHRDWYVRPAVRISAETLASLPAEKNQVHTQDITIPLDKDRLYFLRVFLENGKVDRVSVDRETANDCHYQLSAEAAKRLEYLLSGLCGAGDLVQLLRKYFRDHSDCDLVRLMKQNGIPYQSFHF